jgi:hypothetical protein
MGAVNLVDFEFNEGPGSATTTTKSGNLVGNLGRTKDPANDPIFDADSPSGQATDRSIQLNGVGFLVADDSTNSILAIQTDAFTIETWIKWDSANETRTLSGFAGYGGSYKFGFLNGNLVFTAFGIADIDSTVPMPYDGAWHHVAAAWQPGVGVTFYFDGASTAIEYTNRFSVPANNYLTIGGERLDNAFRGSMDRLRIHKAFLTADQLDSAPGTPKAALPSTVVAYHFNETTLPSQSATTPARPAMSSEEYFEKATRPAFTTDTPSGRAGDYSLSFKRGTYGLAPDLENVIALDQTDPSFTLEAWVKFGALPQDRSVLFGNNGPGGAFSLSVTQTRHVFITTYGIADIPSQAVIPDDGLWHHIAVVEKYGQDLRFYVDGILSDTVAYSQGVIFTRTDTTFALGAEPGLYNPYIGLMDRVRITSGALSPEQLDYLAIPGLVPGAPSLSTTKVQQVSWPTVPAGYKLQSSPSVDPASASWSNVTNAPIAIGTNYTVYLPVTGIQLYYRLVKP